MTDPRRYELTPSELETIIAACQPVPYLVAGGIEPESPRARIRAAWQIVADRVGCDVDSIGPAPGEGDNVFLARPIGVTR